MENASKALIMAGGILISMIVISLFYYTFGEISAYMGTKRTNRRGKRNNCI